MGQSSEPKDPSANECQPPASRSPSPNPSCLSCLSDFILPAVLRSSPNQPSNQGDQPIGTSEHTSFSVPQPESKCNPAATQTMLSGSVFEGSLSLTKSSSILIVGGGGTMGSSTALHLARRGYTNIRILDIYAIPSEQSAGFDLNKIAGGK